MISLVAKKKSKIKRGILLFIFILILSGGFTLLISRQTWLKTGFIDNSSKISQKNVYRNDKFGYSLKYPQNWFMRYNGVTQDTAERVWFVSQKEDLTKGEGGPPQGVTVEVIIQNLQELKEADHTFPTITSIENWLSWERKFQAGFENPARPEPTDTSLFVNNLPAIRTSYSQAILEELGKQQRVTFLHPTKKYVFIIQYLGKESQFSDNLDNFNQIIRSFSFQ